MMGPLKLSDKQLDYLCESTARINAAEGAVRSGKSFVIDLRWLEYTQTHRGPHLMTGKTVDTLDRNVVQPMQEMAGTSTVRWMNKAKGELMIGKALCHCLGMNDAKAEPRLRGMTVGGWLADEVTTYPELAVDQALARMSIPGAQAFWSMNPDSPHHWMLSKYLENAELLAGSNPILKRWHFVLDDNPGLTAEFKDHISKLFQGVFYQRNILGLWVLAEGLVYSNFREDAHVKAVPEGVQIVDYIVGIDYGTSNPCVFLLLGIDAMGRMWLVREYYWDSVAKQRQKSDAEYADDFMGFMAGVAPSVIYADPSAASFIKELRNRGWLVMQATNDVLDGIRQVMNYLASGHLFVDPACTATIKEAGSYRWDPQAQKRGEDKPLKLFDHAMDALRYAIFSHARRSGNMVTDKPQGW